MNKVVIGANFGDEGKGLMTDYFVSQFKGKCFVVRFNGGSQASHTVVTPEGKRHKFSHFGAGSFLGAPTYLSCFFIANPMTFLKELAELDFLPVVCMDGECLITTPYDMHINQLLEFSRGDKRHGSCGVGINETVDRSSKKEYCLKAKDLRDDTVWRDKFKRIAEEHYPKRLEEIDQPNPDFHHHMFVEHFEEFISKVTICDHGILENQDIVFEGAQGLLLDQNHRFFPYVTRSNTGFQNVRVLLEEMQRTDEETEVVYVTRSYLTRHGRGPFPTEIDRLPYKNVVDDTNVLHEFQEHLRFGVLDVSGLLSRIKEDIKEDTVNENVSRVSIAVTCLDQVDNGTVDYYQYNEFQQRTVGIFLEEMKDRFSTDIYASFGRTRKDIQIWRSLGTRWELGHASRNSPVWV